jgi:histidinol-phosphate aminotransferase
MHPYQWEASSAEIAARAGLTPGEVVRFDTNSCPWAGATLMDLPSQELQEYPDSAYPSLLSAIGDYTGLPASAITVGAGADELLGLVAAAFVAPLDPVVIPQPSYAMFTVVTEAAGGEVVTVPADSPDHLLQAARRARLTFVCNPNNPTGGLIPAGRIEELAAASPGVVVVDEAYYEFSGVTCAGLVMQLPNLVVVRTLSKAFGLAGARVGYALSGPALAATLARLRPPASVSATSAALATCALGAAGEMRARVALLRRWGEELERGIGELGFGVRSSAANFLLATCPQGLPEFLATRGLVVRAFSTGHPLHGWMRVTIRSEAENARLLDALAGWGPSRGG